MCDGWLLYARVLFPFVASVSRVSFPSLSFPCYLSLSPVCIAQSTYCAWTQGYHNGSYDGHHIVMTCCVYASCTLSRMDEFRCTSDSCRVLSKDLVMVVGGATCHVGSARGHLCEVCQLYCPLDVPLDNLRMFLVQLHQCVCVEPY